MNLNHPAKLQFLLFGKGFNLSEFGNSLQSKFLDSNFIPEPSRLSISEWSSKIFLIKFPFFVNIQTIHSIENLESNSIFLGLKSFVWIQIILGLELKIPSFESLNQSGNCYFWRSSNLGLTFKIPWINSNLQQNKFKTQFSIFVGSPDPIWPKSQFSISFPGLPPLLHRPSYTQPSSAQQACQPSRPPAQLHLMSQFDLRLPLAKA
jgi:hypothetical protein